MFLNRTDLLSWSSSTPPQFSIKHTSPNKLDRFANLEIFNVDLVSLNSPEYPFKNKLFSIFLLILTPVMGRINSKDECSSRVTGDQR